MMVGVLNIDELMNVELIVMNYNDMMMLNDCMDWELVLIMIVVL